MQIVHVEEDRPAPVERRRPGDVRSFSARGTTCSCDLHFFVDTPGSYPFEKLNLLRRSIYPKFEVAAFQTIHETALLVENHDVGLHDVGIDAQDVRRLLASLGCLSMPDTGVDQQANQESHRQAGQRDKLRLLDLRELWRHISATLADN